MVRSWIKAGLSILVFCVLYVFTALLVIITLILILLSFKRTVPHIIYFWANSLFFIMGKKIHVTGIENIEKSKNYIVVANHASLFDILAIVSFFPTVTWFGHERLLRIPFFRRILKITDYIPFKERNIRNTREMLEQLVQKSKEHSVAIFPEGTRTLDGKINRFYKGFIYLLRATEIDILPVTLNGFFTLKPKNRVWIDFTPKLEVFIHKPIENKQLVEKEDHEILEIVKETVVSEYHPKFHSYP